jgi:hypothetical protein
MKYQIKVKRDFGSGPGYWLPGAGDTGTGKYGFVKSGFIVTDGLCNIIPGACWFRTLDEAMDGIRAHMIAGDTMAWYKEYRRFRQAPASHRKR